MAEGFKGLTQAQINKRIKEGRGAGTGAQYKSFIYTYEVSSSGRSQRLPSTTAGRMHHLLSDLELAVFLILDWHNQVSDIREQFPLRVADTIRIAEELGIAHRKYNGVHQVLSSDFLVNFCRPDEPQVALQVKYSHDLDKPGTLERLMIEKRYWESKGIPWYVVTEKEIPKTVLTNIQWLYPAKSDEPDESLLVHHFQVFQKAFHNDSATPLTTIAQQLDIAYEEEAGANLYWLRQLLSKRYYLFDIHIPFRKLTSADLTPVAFFANGGATNVSS